MPTVQVTVNGVQTANGFQPLPFSLSVHFNGSVHAGHFPQVMVCCQASVVGYLLTNKHLAYSSVYKASKCASTI